MLAPRRMTQGLDIALRQLIGLLPSPVTCADIQGAGHRPRQDRGSHGGAFGPRAVWAGKLLVMPVREPAATPPVLVKQRPDAAWARGARRRAGSGRWRRCR